MYKIKFSIIVLILLAMRICVYPQGKVGTTSFQFLEVMPDARGTSMAGAVTSITDNSEALFWNPAGIVRVDNVDVSASLVQWLFDTKHYAIAAAYKLEGWGTLGLHFVYTDIGQIEVTRVSAQRFEGDILNPGLTGEVIAPHQYVVGLTFARELTDKFSFGITAKYAREDLIVDKKGGLMFDGGLVYRTGFRSIVLSASVLNFGKQIQYIQESYPLPQTFYVGIASNLFSTGESLFGTMGDQNLLVSFNLIQRRDYNQQQSVGLEYSYNNMIFLRGGYKFNGDQEGYSGGLGLKYNNYRIDYSYCDYGQILSSVHRFTIGFEL